MTFLIVTGLGAALVFALAFFGYQRTGSPSALISGGIGAALMALGIAITWSGQSRWMAFIPCAIVTFAFLARGMVSLKKNPKAAPLILTIAGVAAATGLLALFVPMV